MKGSLIAKQGNDSGRFDPTILSEVLVDSVNIVSTRYSPPSVTARYIVWCAMVTSMLIAVIR